MIENFIKNYEYYENASLLKYNTYKIDAKCRYLVFPRNVDEVKELISYLKTNNINYYLLGNGSNIILKNEYYDYVFIKLDKLNNIIIDKDVVKCEAGVSLAKISMMTAKESLSGLEFAYGIPGLVGSSICMNAGAYKEELADILVSVKVLDDKMNIVNLDKKSLNFSYRNSLFKGNNNFVVLEVTFKLKEGLSEEMIEKIQKRKKKRLNTQPLEYPSAGSVFRNPEGMFAGELIEKCGLKGYNINGAEISEKHANFIINKGGAKGKDILELIELITKKVKERYNVDLHLEQIIVD